jgi:hypothetical protein
MSKSDGRTLWRLIDRAEKREAARYEKCITEHGISVTSSPVRDFLNGWALLIQAR